MCGRRAHGSRSARQRGRAAPPRQPLRVGPPPAGRAPPAAACPRGPRGSSSRHVPAEWISPPSPAAQPLSRFRASRRDGGRASAFAGGALSGGSSSARLRTHPHLVPFPVHRALSTVLGCANEDCMIFSEYIGLLAD
ncbi:hypothetical protein BS78_06G246700 [Paspalum vaginatum]|nr:hypothetical protein BS78_06G246700 [Paspalum vaginatum]